MLTTKQLTWKRRIAAAALSLLGSTATVRSAPEVPVSLAESAFLNRATQPDIDAQLPSFAKISLFILDAQSGSAKIVKTASHQPVHKKSKLSGKARPVPVKTDKRASVSAKTTTETAAPAGLISASPTASTNWTSAPEYLQSTFSPWSVEAGAYGTYLPDLKQSSTASKWLNKIPVMQQVSGFSARTIGAKLSIKYAINDTVTLVLTGIYEQGVFKANLDESTLEKKEITQKLPTSVSFVATKLSNLPVPVKNLIEASIIPAVSQTLNVSQTLSQLTGNGLTIQAPKIPLSALINTGATLLNPILTKAINESGLSAGEKSTLSHNVQSLLSDPASIFMVLQGTVNDTSAGLTSAQQKVGAAQKITGKIGKILQTTGSVLDNAATVLDDAAAIGKQATIDNQAALKQLSSHFIAGLAKSLPASQAGPLTALDKALTDKTSAVLGGAVLTLLQDGLNFGKDAANFLDKADHKLASVTQDVAKDLAKTQKYLGKVQTLTLDAQKGIQWLAQAYATAQFDPGSLTIRIVNPNLIADITNLNALLPASYALNPQQIIKDALATGRATLAVPADVTKQIADNFARKYGKVSVVSQDQSGGALLGLEIHPAQSFRAFSISLNAGATVGSGTLGVTAVSETSATYNLGSSLALSGTGPIGWALSVPYLNASLTEQLAKASITLPEFQISKTNYTYKSVGIEGSIIANLDLFSAYDEVFKNKERGPYDPTLIASVGVQGGVQKLYGNKKLPVSYLPFDTGIVAGFKANFPIP